MVIQEFYQTSNFSDKKPKDPSNGFSLIKYEWGRQSWPPANKSRSDDCLGCIQSIQTKKNDNLPKYQDWNRGQIGIVTSHNFIFDLWEHNHQDICTQDSDNIKDSEAVLDKIVEALSVTPKEFQASTTSDFKLIPF